MSPDRTEAAEAPPYQDEHDEQVREGWRIESLDAADWALRRMAELQAEADENAAVLESAILRLRARTERLNERAARGLDFFAGRLREYAEQNRDTLLKGGKKKSRALPSGSIGWRSIPAKVTVADETAALEWARLQPVESELLRIKEEVSKSALAAHFRACGEVPPGCEVVPEHEEFQVKPEAQEAH